MENSEKKTVSRTVIDREVIMRKYHVHIKNFRNLKDVKVTLSPLTILTGENGSGKSTLFKALLFLKHNHDHEAAKKLKYVIDDDINLGGWEHIANDPKKPISIKITEETWGYDHEVEEIYDIDNCPFELNPTEEYAKQWAQFLNKYGISSSLEPFLPKSQRLNTTSGRRIHISSREFVYSEDKLESILLKTGISDIKFKIKYFSKPYSEDIRSLDEMFYPLGKNQFYLMFEKIDTASRIPSDLLPGITKLFFELYSDSTWVSEYNEEKALYEEILNNLRMTILGGEQLTKYSAFRKFIPLTLRSIIESLSYAQYMNILGILYELLDELNDILYKGFINAFSLGTTRKLPESRYLVEKLNSKSYYGIIDYYDFSRHYFDLKDLTVVNVINEQMQKWLTKFELGSDLKIERENDVVKIMLSTMTGKLVSLSEASSGTLQLLPILFLIIKNINLIKIFSIQQPELHLHPRLHSIFADFIIQILSPSYNEMASINESPYMKFIFSNKKMSDYKVYFPDENLAIGRFNKGDKLYNYTVPTHLIIETHSEHLLKKLQVLVSQGKTLQLWTEGYYSGEDVKLKDALSIYYFAKDKNGNTKAIEMELDDNGFFKNFLPEGFFDEGLDLDRQLLLGRN